MNVVLSNKLIGHEHDPGAWQFYFWFDQVGYGVWHYYTPDGVAQFCDSYYLGSFTIQPGIWHKAKLALAGSLVKLYIDDQFILEFDFREVIPFPLENFYLSWMTGGQRDLDDIKVQASASAATAIAATQGVQTAIASLNPSVLKSANLQKPFISKLNAVIADIDAGYFAAALEKLQHDISAKTDGCAASTSADNNDWIRDCASQRLVYPLLLEVMEILRQL